jgi:hypothetical protein
MTGFPYTREKAAFPLEYVSENKFCTVRKSRWSVWWQKLSLFLVIEAYMES